MASGYASTFSPINGNSTLQYSATSASSNNAFPTFLASDGVTVIPIKTMLCFNETGSTVYLTFGAAAATVPTSTIAGGIPLAVGAYVILNIESTSFSMICAGSGTATLDVTYGQGE